MKKIYLLFVLTFVCCARFLDDGGGATTPYVFPSAVLFGQPDFTSNAIVAPSSVSIAQPEEIFTDGTHFFVCDRNNHRVLIWNDIKKFLAGNPAVNNPPDVVIGQTNLTSNTVNAGVGSVNAGGFNWPRSGIVINGKLLISDSNNNRILIWNTIPTSNGVPADVVIGQALMTTNLAANTASGFNHPMGMAWDGNHLFVADRSNHRLVMWNGVPASNGSAAAFVIGQADFTANSGNEGGGPTAISLVNPSSIAIADGKLYVSDRGNNRVLVWNSVFTAGRIPADYVLGQPNFTSAAANNGGRGAGTLDTPFRVYVTVDNLYVIDYANNRVMLWNLPITGSSLPANKQYGETDFTTYTPSTSQTTWNGPISVISYAGSLIVSDQDSNRIISNKGMRSSP